MSGWSKSIFDGDGFGDDAEENEPIATEEGVTIPASCRHCGMDTDLLLPWSEVYTMSRGKPVSGWLQTNTGYVLHVGCRRCYENYQKADRITAAEEAAIDVVVGLEQARRWSAFGRQRGWTGVGSPSASPGAPSLTPQGVVYPTACQTCKTAITPRLPWATLGALVQRKPPPGWADLGAGYLGYAVCPRCQRPTAPVEVTTRALASWLQAAQAQGFVR